MANDVEIIFEAIQFAEQENLKHIADLERKLTVAREALESVSASLMGYGNTAPRIRIANAIEVVNKALAQLDAAGKVTNERN